MKIVQVNAKDISGGAAIACYRLHRGLVEAGLQCRLLVNNKLSADETVSSAVATQADEPMQEDAFLISVLQDLCIDANRSTISDAQFSLTSPGYDLCSSSLVTDEDIINLHWINNYQSPLTISRLLRLGKPVIWTLHDQWAFTGGCHLIGGCDKYRTDCHPCPQLLDDSYAIPSRMLRDKRLHFQADSLTIVTPSKWLAQCVQGSHVLGGRRVEVIPNGVETDVFVPVPKAAAKEKIGISPETMVFLFGARNLARSYKGGTDLIAAIGYALSNPQFSRQVRLNRIKLMCFGFHSEGLREIGLPLISLGYLDSVERTSLAYAASDFLMLPSREDNLPNTMLEAMSCGTPVIGYAVGGIPDVVSDGSNGWLVESGNVTELGRAIVEAARMDSTSRQAMSDQCRRLITQSYSVQVQARNYLALYRDLLTGSGRPRLERTTTASHTSQAGATDLDYGVGRQLREALTPVMVELLKELYSQSRADRGLMPAREEEITTTKQAVKFLLKKIAIKTGTIDFLRKHRGVFGRVW